MMILAVILLLAAAGGLVWLALRARRERRLSDGALDKVRREAQAVQVRAMASLKEALQKRRSDWEAERRQLKAVATEREERLKRLMERVEEREEILAASEGRAQADHAELDRRLQALPALQAGILEARRESKRVLLERAALAEEDARQAYFKNLENAVRHEEEARWDRNLAEEEQDAEFRGRTVLQTVMGRIRTRQVLDPQHNHIPVRPDALERWFVKNPEYRTRLQELTGVEITQEPDNEMRFSAYDGVAREVAKLTFQEIERRGISSVEKLEGMVKEQEAVLLKSLAKIARRFLEGMKLRDIHPDIVQAMGRLRFRTSYGQNILEHSCEAGYIAAHLAAEAGLEPRLAMRCGLLHDLGKALTTVDGGMHDDLGADLAKRCGEHEYVVDAIEGHHHDNASVYTRLAMSGDAISGARPGARRETAEKYVERMEKLTAIATSFPDVQNVATMKAGREVRCQARPGLTDEEVTALACAIAGRVENEVIFPGEILVTAIKETKVVEHAR